MGYIFFPLTHAILEGKCSAILDPTLRD